MTLPGAESHVLLTINAFGNSDRVKIPADKTDPKPVTELQDRAMISQTNIYPSWVQFS